MRKPILAFVLILVSILMSCSSKLDQAFPEIERHDIKSNGVKLLDGISRLKSVDLIRQSYSTLDDQSRFELWLSKLTKDQLAYKEDKEKFSAIQFFIDNLSVRAFQDGDSKEIFQNIFLPSWIEENSGIFSKDEIYRLIFSIDNPSLEKSQPLTLSGDENTDPLAPDCHCKIGSNWTCYLGTGHFANCYKSPVLNCKQLSRGCGALMDDICDGNHCTPL